MSKERPAIPEQIKREVRQRCHFGCVICGKPLYEYEHMKEWAIVKRHIADEITLLCDQHHKEKTNGLLPKQKVYEANKNPYNKKYKKSSPYQLHFSGKSAEFEIGSNVFVAEDYGNGMLLMPLIINDTPLLFFKLKDGNLFLNLFLKDKNDNTILKIIDNELIFAPISWDIEFKGKKIKINEKQREILIEIEFLPPNKIRISRGKIFFKNIEILITNNSINIKNNNFTISNCKTVNCSGGLIINCENPLYSGFFKTNIN